MVRSRLLHPGHHSVSSCVHRSPQSRCYKVLQGATRCYKVLQLVAYKVLQGAQSFPQCAAFCYKVYCRRRACWPAGCRPPSHHLQMRPNARIVPRAGIGLLPLHHCPNLETSCICILPNSQGLMGAPQTAPGRLKGSHQRLPSHPSREAAGGGRIN